MKKYNNELSKYGHREGTSFKGIMSGIIDLLGGIGDSETVIKRHGFEAKGPNAMEVVNEWAILNEKNIVENLDFTKEEVILDGAYAPEETIEISNKTTLKMEKGSTITGPVFGSAFDAEGNVTETDSYGLHVVEGGEIIIDGDGEIKAQEATYSMAVWAQGGKVVINGGTFKNAGDGCDLIYASAGGNVEIYGGEFYATPNTGDEPSTKNKFSTLNVKDRDRANSSIVVYGGIFYGFDPANNFSEGPGTNFVAEGYKSVKRDGKDVWVVIKDAE
jgi:hypothetical protein